MFSLQADKRAHHNALERKRRDHIKDSFTMLRDALPFFQGDKVRVSFVNHLCTVVHYSREKKEKSNSAKNHHI